MSEEQAQKTRKLKTPEQILDVLMQGNKHYAESLKKNSGKSVELNNVEVHTEVSPGVVPAAAVISCADSRVTPEIIFNCGIGDIFVIRVAGNVVDSSNPGVVGSLEFGVLELGARLILVLGHSECGAVAGAIDSVKNKKEFPGSIGSVVESIVPAVESVKDDDGDLWKNSVVSNVKKVVDNLLTAVPPIAQMAAESKIMIVGGYYDLRTGEVKIVT